MIKRCDLTNGIETLTQTRIRFYNRVFDTLMNPILKMMADFERCPQREHDEYMRCYIRELTGAKLFPVNYAQWSLDGILSKMKCFFSINSMADNEFGQSFRFASAVDKYYCGDCGSWFMPAMSSAAAKYRQELEDWTLSRDLDQFQDTEIAMVNGS
jgi:hypothetical protein